MGRLDDRILGALQGLPGRIAFNGLRRVLGAHPESLARALRRLEREGRVERTVGGYRARFSGASVPASGDPLRQIARLRLPAGVDPAALSAQLTGRWFGSLRWVGVIERPGRRWLTWAERDGSNPVLLSIDHGAMRVAAPVAADGSDPNDSAEPAYELLVRAMEAVRPSVRAADAGGGPSTPAWSPEN